MSYYRKAFLPKEPPTEINTYFCVWEVGDTHWHGAAEWTGKKFKEERNPLLKGMQPTYWLKQMEALPVARKLERFTNQALGEPQVYEEIENLYE